MREKLGVANSGGEFRSGALSGEADFIRSRICNRSSRAWSNPGMPARRTRRQRGGRVRARRSRGGRYDAASMQVNRSTPTPSVSGSDGRVRHSRACATRAAGSASGSPAASPATPMAAALPSTWRRMAAGVAAWNSVRTGVSGRAVRAGSPPGRARGCRHESRARSAPRSRGAAPRGPAASHSTAQPGRSRPRGRPRAR